MDQETLKSLVFYENGNLYYRPGDKLRRKSGALGRVGDRGYINICLLGKMFKAHRLIWLYHHGRMPECIDHINGARSDNRIENLRECTIADNRQNLRGARKDSSSGVLGVSWHGRSKRWRAKLTVGGKEHYLGAYVNIEDASRAYLDAKRRLHPFNTL